MVAAPVVLSVIKYGFLGLVVTGAGFLIANTAVMMKHKSEAIADLRYTAHVSTAEDSSELDKNAGRCITHPHKPFCLLSSSKKIQLLKRLQPTRMAKQNVSVPRQQPPNPLYMFLEKFSNLTNALNIKPILVEPFILFCMLSPTQKYALISNGFDTNILQGSDNIVTFVVFEKESEILNQESSINLALESKFEISRAKKWLKIRSTNGILEDFFTTDYFYSQQNFTAHVMVFFQRQNLLWHPVMTDPLFQSQYGAIVKNSIYENFTAMPLYVGSHQQMNYPSQLLHFMRQIQDSEFVECKSPANYSTIPHWHVTLTNEQLHYRAQITIQELKLKLKPMMTNIWLWKETLQGWYESCHLFQKAPKLLLAARFISKVDFNKTFSDNEYLRLLEWENKMIILDCFGLEVNLFLIYEDFDSDTNSELKITYPKFKLCSTSIMDQLVHIPCINYLKTFYNNSEN